MAACSRSQQAGTKAGALLLGLLLLLLQAACSKGGGGTSPLGNTPAAYKFPGISSLAKNADGTWTLGWEKAPGEKVEYAVFSRVGAANYTFDRADAIVTDNRWVSGDLSLKDSTCFAVRFSSPAFKDDKNTTELCTNHERFVFPGLTSLDREPTGAYTLRWPVLSGQKTSYHIYYNSVSGGAIEYDVPLVIVENGEYTTRVLPLGESHCFVVRMAKVGLPTDVNTSAKCTGDEVSFEFGGVDNAVDFNGEPQCTADAQQVSQAGSANDLQGAVCVWWTASSHPDVAGFNVYATKQIAGNTSRDPFARLVKTVAKDRLGALLIGLEPGATYDVGVRAFDSAGREERNRRKVSVRVSDNVVPRFGGVSSVVAVNPDANGKVDESKTPGTITVNWRPADGFPSGYRIYLSRTELNAPQSQCDLVATRSVDALNAELAQACTSLQDWDAGKCTWYREEELQGVVGPECEAAGNCFATSHGFQKLADEMRYSVLVRAVSKSCDPARPGSCIEDSNKKCVNHVVPDYGAPRFDGIEAVENTLGRITLYWRKPLGSVAFYEVFKEDIASGTNECSAPSSITNFNRSFQQINLADVSDASESVDGPRFKGLKKAVLANLGENPAFKVALRAVDGNKFSDGNSVTRSLCLSDQTPPEFRGFLFAHAETEKDSSDKDLNGIRVRVQRTTETLAEEDAGISYRVDVWRIENVGGERTLIPLVAVTPGPAPLANPPAGTFAIRPVSQTTLSDAQTLKQVPAGEQLEFMIENLQRAKKYGVLVRPIDKAGNASTNTSMAEVVTLDKVSPVFAGVKTAEYDAARSTIVVRWDAASDDSGISRYLVSGRVAGTSAWTWQWNVPGNATSKDILGMAGATSYEFKVVAQDASPAENTASNEVVSAPVYQPFEVSPSFGGIANAVLFPDPSRNVKVTWVKLQSGQVAEYRIYRCEVGASGNCLNAGDWTRVATADANGEALLLSGDDAQFPMSDHRTYRFRIRAVSQAGGFEDKNDRAVQVRIPDLSPPVFSNPAGLLSAAVDNAKVAVRFTWATASDNVGVAWFRIYRKLKTAPAFDYTTPFAEVAARDAAGALVTETTIAGFAQGGEYEFALRAVDAAGNSVEGTAKPSLVFQSSNPPVARSAVLQGPMNLHTGDTVTCLADFGDVDGDIQSVVFRFRNVGKNGVRSTQTVTSATRSATYVLRSVAATGGDATLADVSGDTVRCEVDVSDARGNAGAAATVSVQSPPLTLLDSAPTWSLANASLLSQTVTAGQALAPIAPTLSDPDGHPVTLEETAGTDGCNAYTVSGGNAVTSAALPNLNAVVAPPASGGVCTARFRAKANGLYSSSDMVVRTTVLNRAPNAPAVTLAPLAPHTDNDLTCSAGAPSDPDGDLSLDVTYSWRVGSTWATATAIPGAGTATLPAALTRSGQKYWCQVSVSDRREGGVTSAAASVDVVNRAPSLAAAPVSLTANPTSKSLSAVVLTAGDSDADSLSFTLLSWKTTDATPVDCAAGSAPVIVPRVQTGGSRLADVWWTPQASFISAGKFNRSCVAVFRVSDGTLSADSASVTFEAQNRSPVAAARVLPAQATAFDTLLCETAASVDADGDALTFTYRWKVAGSVVVGETQATLVPGKILAGLGRPFRAGDAVACEVTAKDGRKVSDGITDAQSASWSADLTIQNARPQIVASLPSVTTFPLVPMTAIALQASDSDGTPLTLSLCDTTACPNYDTGCAGETFTLTQNAQSGNVRTAQLAWTPTSGAIPAGQTSKACVVIVRASDGQDPVPACAVNAASRRLEPPSQRGCVELVLTAANRAPLATAPRVCAGAECEAVVVYNDTGNVTCDASAASDPDGILDAVTPVAGGFRWTRNGALVTGATSATLASANFDVGDRVACGATIRDSHTAQTVSALSSEIVVSNRAPSAAAAVLPATPNQTSTLTCDTTGSSDPDNNGAHRVQSLSYAYVWEKMPPAGAYAAIPGQTGSTLSPSYFGVDDTVRCKVQASDGSLASAWAVAAGKVVANRAPTLTVSVASVATNPTVAATAVTLTAVDADGDPLSIVEVSDGCGNLVPSPVPENQLGLRRRAAVNFTPPAGFIPSGATQRTCTVTYKATDGHATNGESALASLDYVVQNRKPVMASATTTVVGGGSAVVGTTLRCGGSATDADSDALQYTCTWWRSPDGSTGWAQIPGSQTACTPAGANADYTITAAESHKYVRCSLTPNDTHEDGLALSSPTSAFVVNSNPSPFNATLSALPLPAVVNGTTFTCDAPVLPNPLDPDNDVVTYTYKWLVSSDGTSWSTTNRSCPGPTHAAQVFAVPAPAVPLASPSAVSWVPCGQDAHKYVTCAWLATDSAGGVRESATPAPVQLTNTNPVLAAVGNRTVAENALLSFSLSATDVDLDTLTYSIDSCTPPSPFAAGVCTGLAVDAVTGAVTWTPAFNQSGDAASGNYGITFKVSDGNGGTDVKSAVVTVTHTNRQPNAFAATLSVGDLKMGDTWTCAGTTTDPDADGAHGFANAGANLSYSYQWKAASAVNGPFADVTTCPGATGSVLTLCKEVAHKYVTCEKRATDDGAVPLFRDATVPTALAVANTAPALVDPADGPVSEGALLTRALAASDLDMDAQTFALTGCTPPAGGSCPTPGAGLGQYAIGTVTCSDAATPDRKVCGATFQWTPGYTQSGNGASGIYTLTFAAADGLGGTHSQQVDITVNHTNRPPNAFVAASASTNWKVSSAATCSGTTTDPDDDGNHAFAGAGKNLGYTYRWKKSTAAAGPVWSDAECAFNMTTGVLTLCSADAHMWLTCVATATDDGATPLATVAATPAPVQQANTLPVAAGATVAGTEDVQVVVSLPRNGTPGYSDADADDAVSFEASSVTGGTLVVSTGACTAGTCEVRLNPTADLAGNGAAGFDFRVNDGRGWSNVAHVTINLAAVNDAPRATGSSVTVVSSHGANAYEDSELLCDETGAFTDVDGPGPLVYSYQWKKGGANIVGATAATLTGADFSHGDTNVTCVVSASDQYAGGSGPAPGTLSRAAGNGFSIQNTAPNAWSLTLSPATVRVGQVLTCGAETTTDIDGDGLTYSYQWQISSDGATYADTALCGSGTAASFTVCKDLAHKYVQCVKTATDDFVANPLSNVSNVSLGVSNTAPVLSDPADTSVSEGDLLSFSLQSADVDMDTQTFTLTSCMPAAGGSCPTAGTGLGQYTIGAVTCSDETAPDRKACSASFSWRPSYTQSGNALSGTYTLTFRSADGHSGTHSQSVQVTVNHTNRAPNPFVATLGKGATWKVGDTLSCDGTTTDPDDDGNHGFANAGKNISYTYQWRKADDALGANATDAACAGATAQVLTLCALDAHKFLTCVKRADDDGTQPDTAPVVATAPASLQMQNTPPVAVAGTVAGTEDTLVTVTLQRGVGTPRFDDNDGDGATGIFTRNAVGGTVQSASCAAGSCSVGFLPAADLFGVGAASFEFRVTDPSADSSGWALVTIDLAGTPDAPVLADPGAKAVAEGSTLSFTLTSSDVDLADQTLSVTGCTPPTGGTCAGYGIGAVTCSPATAPTRRECTATFSWTPGYAQSGSQLSGVYALTLTADDGTGRTHARSVSVTVNHTNRAPNPFSASLNKGASWKVGDTLSCDGTTTDPDDDGNHLFANAGKNVSYGYQWKVASDVSGTGEANSTCPGSTGYTLTLCANDAHKFLTCVKSADDDGAQPDNAPVVATIPARLQLQNTPPSLASPGDKSVSEGALLSFQLVSGDVDLDTQSFVLDSCTAPDGGTCPGVGAGLGQYTITASGCVNDGTPKRVCTADFAWTPSFIQAGNQASGVYALRFKSSDGLGGESTQTINVAVNHVNRAPGAFTASITKGATWKVGDTLVCDGTSVDPDAVGHPFANAGANVSYTYQWRKADNAAFTLNATNAACPGATSGTLTLCDSDAHKYLTCLKWADDDGISPDVAPVAAAPTPVPVQMQNSAPSPFAVTINPAIVKVNTNASCDGTTTDPDGNGITYTYQWRVANFVDPESAATYANITGGTTQIFKARQSDRGKYLKCVKTATDVPPGGVTPLATVASNYVVVDNTTPVFTAVAAQNVNEGALLAFNVEATDVDGDNSTFVLDSCQQVPTGGACPTAGGGLGQYALAAPVCVSISGDQRCTSGFSWTPSYTQAGNQDKAYVLRFKATDALNAVAYYDVTVSVAHTNRAPTAFSSSIPEGSTKKVGDTLTCSGSTTDPDGTDGAHGWTAVGTSIASYTYRWVSSATVNGTYVTSTCPGAATNALTLCAAESHRYFKCEIRAYDNGSPQAFTDASVGAAVQVLNSVPVLADPADASVNEGTTLSFSLSATDTDNDTLTYSLSSCTPPAGSANCNGLSVTGSTGAVSWTPSYVQSGSQAAGVYSAVFQVSDGNGGTHSQTVNLTVNHVNRAPAAFLAASTPAGTVLVGSTLTCTGTTTDPDAGDPFRGGTIAYSYQWYVSSNSAGPFSAASTCPGAGTATLTLCDAEAHKYFACAVTATDNDAPAASTVSTASAARLADNSLPVVTGATVNGTEDTLATITITKDGAAPKYTDADNDLALEGTGGIQTQSATNGTVQSASCSGGTCTVQFQPAANFNGTASFQFRIVDAVSGVSGWATVNVSVAAVDDSPTVTGSPAISGTLKKGYTLTCDETAAGFADVDSALTYSYKWFKAPNAVDPIATTKTLADTNFAHGDVLTCRVWASDGVNPLVASGLSGSATILNTAPNLGAASVSLQEATVYETNTLHCQISGASDIDGDGLAYEYRFMKNTSTVVQDYAAGNSLAPALGQRAPGDVYFCTVRVSDGQGGSTTKDSGTYVVQNAISAAWGTAPSITIDSGTCKLTVPGTASIDTPSCDYLSSGYAAASVGAPYTNGTPTATDAGFTSWLSLDDGTNVRAGGTLATTWTLSGRVAGGADVVLATKQLSRNLTLTQYLAGAEYALSLLSPQATVAGNASEGMEVSPNNANANRCTWCVGNRGILSVGGGHACAVVNVGGNDTIQCWGKNNYGQLGNNSTTQANAPVSVQSSPGVTYTSAGGGIVALQVSDAHKPPASAVEYGFGCAVESTGLVRCWGGNLRGQLGTNDLATLSTASKYVCAVGVNCNDGSNDAAERLTDVVAIATGGQGHDTTDSNSAGHACALQSSGRVRCWGRSFDGELGDGNITGSDRVVADAEFQISSGVAVTDGLAVATGARHSCVLVSEGGTNKVRCVGVNDSYQLGARELPATVAQRAYASELVKWDTGADQPNADLSGVKALASGAHFTCALLDTGMVSCWGRNSVGQLGDASLINRWGAVWVCKANSNCNQAANFGNRLSGVVAIAAGFEHACALLADNSVQCWGGNSAGQLGDGLTANRSYAQPLSPANGAQLNYRALSAGGRTTCGLSPEGDGTSKVVCWGEGTSGQMGDSNATSSSYANRYPTGLGGVRSKSCAVYQLN